MEGPIMETEREQDGELSPSDRDAGAADELRQGAQTAREAMDRLNEKNRILSEAIMLPRTAKLSIEQIDTIAERFAEYVKSRGISMKQAAKEIGYSRSTLSEWNGAKYLGDVDAVGRAINQWMELDSRRRSAHSPKDYVQTWIAEDMRSQVYLADKHGLMLALVVPAGAGKTMVLKALTEELRGVYVSCEAGMTGRDLFFKIAEALGWNQKGGSRGELSRFIISILAGTKRIIFLDEAHQLGDKIGMVRSIHDEAKVPIVFAGTDDILRAVNDRAHGRGQFSSRTIRYNALDLIHNAETPGGAGRDLFSIEEIKAFFAMKHIRVDRGALEMCWRLACLPNYGTLRTIENAIDLVFDAEPHLQVVTRDHIIEALQLLVGAESIHMLKLVRRDEEASRPAAIAKAG
jgi:DNA transposition AAA+ family ATPase